MKKDEKPEIKQLLNQLNGILKQISELRPAYGLVLHEFQLLTTAIQQKFKHLTTEEAEDLAATMIVETTSRFRNDENIAFIRYENEDEIALTEYGFEFIDVQLKNKL